MARKKRLQLLLSDLEYQNLKEYAQTKQIPMSEVLRDYIKTLPHPLWVSQYIPCLKATMLFAKLL